MATDRKARSTALICSILGLVMEIGCAAEARPPDDEQEGINIPAFPCVREGGIVLCNTTEDSIGAPNYQACFEAAKAIIDNCQGSILECLAQSKCTLCNCLGPQYCPCTGIV
jgi:hypothetical protein